MSLSDGERVLIVRMEFEKSDRFMAQADANASMGMWDVVANRIYYAVFHAAAGMFIHDGYEVRSHTGAVVVFGQKYVATGLFTGEDGRLYSKLQDLREKSDYNLVYQSNEEEMRPLIEKSKALVEKFKIVAGVVA